MIGFGRVPVTPTAFLQRAATVHGDRTAVMEAGKSLTYADMFDRCRRFAGALVGLGVKPGDRVSVLAPNSGAMLEAHFGVPWAGAILNTINTRLSPQEIAYIVDHAGSKVLLVDAELATLAKEALACAAGRPQLILCGGPAGESFEDLLENAPPVQLPVEDEYSVLSINYTSGTTGRPKGVKYSHRGAFLQALAMMNHVRLDASSRYLWTVPMFHCNGWCFPWAVTAAGGQHILVRRPDPATVWNAIAEHGVTHLSGAPTVLMRLAAEPPSVAPALPISVTTGGAPPSPTLLARLGALNFDVMQVYGLTETYGPAAICDWRPEWNSLDAEAKAVLKARQGVGNVVSEPIRVWADGREVPHDGKTVGEIQLRGNNVMLGYYKDDEATLAATCDGWFRSGDLGVIHPDGYLELRDRSKDVIISGGENITSVEVEQAIDAHPAVLESAVVGQPDDEWGEIVTAFVTLAPGQSVTEAELIEHVRARIARFKAPRRVYFRELPKTATGKIQKFRLRNLD